MKTKGKMKRRTTLTIVAQQRKTSAKSKKTMTKTIELLWFLCWFLVARQRTVYIDTACIMKYGAMWKFSQNISCTGFYAENEAFQAT